MINILIYFDLCDFLFKPAARLVLPFYRNTAFPEIQKSKLQFSLSHNIPRLSEPHTPVHMRKKGNALCCAGSGIVSNLEHYVTCPWGSLPTLMVTVNTVRIK